MTDGERKYCNYLVRQESLPNKIRYLLRRSILGCCRNDPVVRRAAFERLEHVELFVGA